MMAVGHTIHGRFRDRRDAGQQLAALLDPSTSSQDFIVLAMPRGGVPVAYQVATALAAPLDVFLVRKLGVPGREELALGALASGGVRVLNDEVLAGLSLPPAVVAEVTAREMAELERRERLYREGRPPLALEGRAVLLVDDGVATGASASAAITALRQRAVRAVTLAVPVGPPSTLTWLASQVDELVCLLMPEPFFAVGSWYVDFGETTDDEVCRLLATAQHA
ncbi:MAG TPA: phosphoribosyltransferase [Ktedonobacterales bacterium]|nr:phosphoribosyltransferase [Ktedonobacterales bacterium]